VLKKWKSVQDIKNNGYSDVCHKKKREKKKKRKRKKKIAHILKQKYFPSFKQERHVLKGIVEIG
jgi:hypothetical protein